MTEREFVQRNGIVNGPTTIGIAFIVCGLAECLDSKRNIRQGDIRHITGSQAVGFANYAQGLERILNGAMDLSDATLAKGRKGQHGFTEKFDLLRNGGSLDALISKHYYASVREIEDGEIPEFIAQVESGFMSARYLATSDHKELEPLDECMSIAVAAGIIEKFFPEDLDFFLLRLKTVGLFV